ncbi:hypothetical protein L2E82_32007 [Cichorium intybus]|uniref:Uncharacterized protein n=1 Tax=Cichorium intybus TaxID=13427 RepID=A0ACB9BGT6_CICIN|nr:hypothetical protein L2E82_32007 [Cichorium intybus]
MTVSRLFQVALSTKGGGDIVINVVKNVVCTCVDAESTRKGAKHIDQQFDQGGGYNVLYLVNSERGGEKRTCWRRRCISGNHGGWKIFKRERRMGLGAEDSTT